MPTTTRTRSSSSNTKRRDRSEAGRSDGGGARRRSRVERGERRITAKNLRAEDRRFLEKNAAELSDSTLRAKWLYSPDEHQDRPGQTLATRSPGVIRAWAEARGGQPATVGRRDEGERPRTLRFDFEAGGRGGRLQPVSWEDWLGTFEDRKLVFVFQEQRRDGRDSNFFRLDSPERQEG